METSYPVQEQHQILARFASVHAPILALSLTDDEYATEVALRRTLSYFGGAERQMALLPPEMLGETTVGHFSPFRARFHDSFWPISLAWLRDGIAPVASQFVDNGPRPQSAGTS